MCYLYASGTVYKKRKDVQKCSNCEICLLLYMDAGQHVCVEVYIVNALDCQWCVRPPIYTSTEREAKNTAINPQRLRVSRCQIPDASLKETRQFRVIANLNIFPSPKQDSTKRPPRPRILGLSFVLRYEQQTHWLANGV